MFNPFEFVRLASEIAANAAILALVTAVLIAIALIIRNYRSKDGQSPKGHWFRYNLPNLRKYYWAILLFVGILLAIGAIVFYLYEIARSVDAMVARLWTLAHDPASKTEDVRNIAQGAALLLAALAAATTLIFQLVRVWINERTTTVAEQGHITQLINTAVEGLGAEKSVRRVLETPRYRQTDEGEWIRDETGQPVPAERPDGTLITSRETVEATEPNLEVRTGAIYALERISQDSPRDHIRIMEILCAYIRENAPGDDAPSHGISQVDLVTDDGDAKLRDWVESLPKSRTDIQTALEVIGRRKPAQIKLERGEIVRGSDVGYRLDLRGANLRNCDISELDFINADLSGAHLERAYLRYAHLEGADLRDAHLEGADLGRAHLERANLGGAHFDKDTDFNDAVAQYATVKSSDLSMVNLDQTQVDSMFGDGTMAVDKLPEGISRPAHWPKIELGVEKVDGQYVDRLTYQRDKWAADPENYVPPTK